jgi:hypothetical protein
MYSSQTRRAKQRHRFGCLFVGGTFSSIFLFWNEKWTSGRCHPGVGKSAGRFHEIVGKLDHRVIPQYRLHRTMIALLWHYSQNGSCGLVRAIWQPCNRPNGSRRNTKTEAVSLSANSFCTPVPLPLALVVLFVTRNRHQPHPLDARMQEVDKDRIFLPTSFLTIAASCSSRSQGRPCLILSSNRMSMDTQRPCSTG